MHIFIRKYRLISNYCRLLDFCLKFLKYFAINTIS